MKNSLKKAKEMRRWLKNEWVDLWTNKYSDAMAAEGISVKDYSLLEVESGEVIHATRDFKPLSFHDVLEKHVGRDFAERVDIDPKTGGWRKFAKDMFPVKRGKDIAHNGHIIKHDLSQHTRKGGAGWRNKSRIMRKKRENMGLE